MTDLNKSELRRLAEGAAGGHWFAEDLAVFADTRIQVCCGAGRYECCGAPNVEGEARDPVCSATHDGAAQFIAAANPSAILSLLDDLRSAESRLHEVATACATAEQERDQYRKYGCTTCDGSGHVHRLDGEYLGACESCLAYKLSCAESQRDRFRTESKALAGLLKRFVDGEDDQDENLAERHMYFTDAQSLLALVGGYLEEHAIVPDSAIKAQNNEVDQLRAEVEALGEELAATERRALKFIHQFNAATDLGRELRIALEKIVEEGGSSPLSKIAFDALEPFRAHEAAKVAKEGSANG